MKRTPKKLALIGGVIILLFVLLIFGLVKKTEALVKAHQQLNSIFIFDRNTNIINIKPNYLGYYSEPDNNLPPDFVKMLLKKEDKFFKFHPGINPASLLRGAYSRVFLNKNTGASTITMQLAKIMLGNENQRTTNNKLKELIYTIGLEMVYSKTEILEMYLNSVYFGNQMQGLKAASRFYFDKSPSSLNSTEQIQLLATINNPSYSNPFTQANINKSKTLAQELSIEIDGPILSSLTEIKNKKDGFFQYAKPATDFELSALPNCEENCKLQIDQTLNEELREIMRRNLEALAGKNTTNAAVVVLKEPENQLLAIVGSPDPSVDAYGYRLNMAIKPRPIGSTIKPFLYAKGFEDDLRPYTKVIDKEYKYIINDGYAFYPKNYDYQYRGEVNLHYALSNSLNVPAVKVLEHVGIDNFSDWLVKEIKLAPVQNIRSYQLGLVLGGLEMDLVSLTYYFSIFANNGNLKPLVYSDKKCWQAELSADLCQNKKIFDKKYIELINKILTDRLTGEEQFGARSSLNLPYTNYGVKTGTSREYHDSWTMGYTPDFVVGVWAGNHDDSPMDAVSGQSGAGRIWQETMQLLYNSKYNRNTSFRYSSVTEYPDDHGLEYGLANDNYEFSKNILLEDHLILKPYDGDIFSLDNDTQIPFHASRDVEWSVNEKTIGYGRDIIFQPNKTGVFEIKAKDEEKTEVIKIILKEQG